LLTVVILSASEGPALAATATPRQKPVLPSQIPFWRLSSWAPAKDLLLSRPLLHAQVFGSGPTGGRQCSRYWPLGTGHPHGYPRHRRT